MTGLLITLTVIAVVALWVVGSRVRYHLGDRPRLLRVTTADGWTLSLWHRAPATRRFEEPVVLCHGLGNNHAFFEFRGRAHLARVLAEAGFEVFTMDCRGAGRWSAPDLAFAEASIDDHLDLDAPAVVDAIREATGRSQVLWVGHSLGGVIGLLASARGLRGRLKALVTLGSPVFFDSGPFFRRALRLGLWLAPSGRFPARVLTTAFAPVAGWFAPPKLARITARVDNIDGLEQRYLLANVFANLWRGVLAQLERWIETGVLSSGRGDDLRAAAFAIDDVPTLVVGGTVDHLAPLEVTKQLFEGLSAKDKALVLVGRQFGQSVDYGHGDLVVGRDADTDVYPQVQAFLVRHASLTPSQSESGARETRSPSRTSA
jgi:pimeloyl-ACP methyl ester carboxylesterase